MVSGIIFKALSIPNHKSWGAEILRECQVSGAYYFFVFTKWLSLSGEGLLSTGPTPPSFPMYMLFEVVFRILLLII